MEKKLPDASDAEKWLDPDTFVVKGRVYRFQPDMTIREVVSEKEKEMTDKEFKFTDHLKEHMTYLAERYLNDHDSDDLPVEFKGIARDRLISLLVDGATPILRKIEYDAITASVEWAAALIRSSKQAVLTSKRQAAMEGRDEKRRHYRVADNR